MLFETRDIADLFNTTFFIGCCGMNLMQPWNISLLGLELHFFSLTGDQYLPFIHYSEVTQSRCYIFLFFFLWFFFKLLSWKLFSRFVFRNNLFVFGSFLCLSYVVREYRDNAGWNLEELGIRNPRNFRFYYLFYIFLFHIFLFVC